MSEGALLSRMRDRIDAYGFTMMAVEGPDPWIYTIGLIESFDHPELVVTGLDGATSHELLTEAVDRLRNGARLDIPSTVVALRAVEVPLTLGTVHPSQWASDRFAMWLAYYQARGLCPEPAAIQLVWPHGSFCSHHAAENQPILSRRAGGDSYPSGRATPGGRPNRTRAKRRRR